MIQTIQTGSTALVGGRTAMIRARIAVSGSAAAVPGVDALLRVFVNGQEQEGSPTFSINGPITAPLSPQLTNLDHTINFLALVPVSGNVQFEVVVDPANAIAETNESNNSFLSGSFAFVCRDVVDLAYVPINYTANGAGMPPAHLIEPGVGDNFIRAIFAPGTLNYHISPTPPLTWATNINNSNNLLLNTLKDIRMAQIPALGYPTPDFIYGWLPGNPYSGNGQANGIPGDAAFGNSAPERFQRTFAHEVGHLVGLSHNNSSINTVGVDVEHHLNDPQGIPQVFPTTKKDIMVAGLLTADAFVNLASFNKFLNDSRVLCPPGGGGQGGPGGEDAPAAADPAWGSLRVSGEFLHDDRSATLDPVFHFANVAWTADDPTGDVVIRALDGAGATRWSLRVDTQRTRERCCGGGVLLPSTPFHVLVPRVVDGAVIDAVVVADALDGRILATRARSANPPVPQMLAAEAIEPGPGPARPGAPAALEGMLRLTWTAEDADGDELTHQLFYSRDEGLSWLPLAMNIAGSAFEFDASTVPASVGNSAWFKVRTSDGFDSVDSPVMAAAALGMGNPPHVHLVSPNQGSTHLQHAPICLHASAWDLEDLLLPAGQIAWTSSLDGPLGTGRLFLTSALSPGVHQISVVGTDSDGLSTAKSVTITVLPRTIFGADLNRDGIVDGADLGLLLSSWGDSLFDLDGDGVVTGSDLGVLLSAWGAH
ncbi:MAG TPA: CARDB domain-containing protein [Phycisphaerales bacterium]|nr:CARDB domain-containing protein [Phycisphaerales bacterium]HMP37257.1 CARDB domain-containing protein [Phycisphaerales bacterium]